MANLSLGATNDSIEEILRKHLSPALAGKGWDALLAGLATGDRYRADLARAAFNQLFKSSASGGYLDRLLADEGLTRPPSIGISDDVFRQLGIKTNARKLLIQVILEVLETYYGSEATRAYSTAANAEPYSLIDGDTLLLEIDDRSQITVTLEAAQFTNIGSATALEVVTAINRSLMTRNSAAFATVFRDPESGDSFVRIFSGALGLYGSMKVLGGRAQNVFDFPARVHVSPNGPRVGTTWDLTPGNGSNGVDSGRVRIAWSAGANPELQDVYVGDYVNIFGATFQPANRGVFEIKEVTTTYFEIENLVGIAQATVVQTSDADLRFFRPEKRTIQSTGRAATATQGTPGQLEVTLPATTQAVGRRVNTGAYLHGPASTLTITSGTRSASGEVTVTTSNAHGLSVNDWIFVDEVEADVVLTPETFGIGDATFVFEGRYGAGVVKLLDGRVLACGGGTSISDPQDTVFIYEPDLNEWTEVASMNTARAWHAATVMSDGRVLVVGGWSSASSAEIYDPSTDTWSPTAAPSGSYEYPSAVKLLDGRVLAIGASDAEIFNPNTSTWTSTGGLLVPLRNTHLSALLPDGRVVVVGGDTATGEIYNPTNNQWVQTGSLSGVDRNNRATLTSVKYGSSGGALLVGGVDDGATVDEVYFFNPATLEWEPRAPLLTPRWGHSTVVLPDGRILVSGGVDDFDNYLDSEIYDLKRDKWSAGPWVGSTSMIRNKNIVLDNKKVLEVAGVETSLTPVFSGLLTGKIEIRSGGGLNGLFRVTAIDSTTVFRYQTPDYQFRTNISSGTVTTQAADTDNIQGPFIYDTTGGSAITGIESTLTSEIIEGSSYNTISVADASQFPDSEGWLCFGFGTNQKVEPVRYLGRVTDQSLLLDPSYTFPRTLGTGISVTLLKQRGSWTPTRPESVGTFYVTAASAGRIAASDTIDEIVAAGVNVQKIVVYPSDKGLGNEGSPDFGSSKISDRVSVWGGDSLDTELAEAREA